MKSLSSCGGKVVIGGGGFFEVRTMLNFIDTLIDFISCKKVLDFDFLKNKDVVSI